MFNLIRKVESDMPGPAIPLIIGAGARLLAGQAIKQGAKQGAKQVAKRKVGAARKTPSKYKKKEIGNPVSGQYDTRTKGRARAQAQFGRAQKQRIKSATKTGEIKQPTGRPKKGYGAPGPISSRMTKAPVKPSKARRGPSNPKRRKR